MKLKIIRVGKDLCVRCKFGIIEEVKNQSFTKDDGTYLFNVTLYRCNMCKSVFEEDKQ